MIRFENVGLRTEARPRGAARPQFRHRAALVPVSRAVGGGQDLAATVDVIVAAADPRPVSHCSIMILATSSEGRLRQSAPQDRDLFQDFRLLIDLNDLRECISCRCAFWARKRQITVPKSSNCCNGSGSVDRSHGRLAASPFRRREATRRDRARRDRAAATPARRRADRRQRRSQSRPTAAARLFVDSTNSGTSVVIIATVDSP